MGADTTTSRRRPDARFLVSHPAHFIALGFGAGLLRPAPGTWGTLVAIPLVALLELFLPPLLVAFMAIPVFFLGVWACTITGRDLGVEDHGSMVIDEVAAFMPLCALTLPGAIASANPLLLGLAFLLFRLFDIVKPPPIRALENNVRGGLGVMIDDVLAAFYAYVVFVIFITVMYKVFGFQ